MRKILLSLTLAAWFILVGCTDQALTNLSRALNDTAQGLASLQQVVIESNKTGNLSDQATEDLLRLCVRIDQGGKQATQLTRNLVKLAPADRTSILGVLRPVIAAVGDTVSSGLTGLSDPVKSRILLVLQSIQTALNSAQVILAGAGA